MSSSKILVIVGAAAAGLYLLSRSSPPAQRFNVGSSSVATPRGSGTTSTIAWLGSAVSQLIGATSYDPSSAVSDRNTPNTNPNFLLNPVSSSPLVLPYSYKQATVDIPSLLGTDDLFTPGPGSSGGYSDGDSPGTAAGPTAYSYDDSSYYA